MMMFPSGAINVTTQWAVVPLKLRSTCIVAGPEIVRAPLVVKVPVTSGNPAKSNVAVMVTGTGVGVADAEGAEPIAKQPSTSRIVVNVMFRFFILLISFCSFVVWPSLTSHREKLVLAVHWCTARKSTTCYAES